MRFINTVKKEYLNNKFQNVKFYLIIALISFTFSFLGYKLSAKPQIIPNIVNILLNRKASANEIDNNSPLLQRIIKETPELSGKNPVDQFETVNTIRNWTFKNIPQAAEEKLTVLKVTGKISRLTPLLKRFELFDNGVAGAWCGTTATTLREIYELFGYEAYEVDTGDLIHPASQATHVVTIVKIKYNGKEIWNVQDAYLNYTLTNLAGEPLDYFDVLNILSAKKDFQIKILENSQVLKPRITSVKLTGNLENTKYFPNGNEIYQSPFTISSNIKTDFFNIYYTFLKEYSYPNNFLYIYLFPISIYGKNTDQAKDLLNQARTITGYWCYDNENCWMY